MDYNPQALDSTVQPSTGSRLVIGPNASLSTQQAHWVMGLTIALTFGIAVIVALLGFWLVPLFAVLELAALGAALYASVRHNGYREVLVFTPEHVKVEIGMLRRGMRTVVELERGPTRVLLEPGANRHAPNQLMLSCRGRRVTIGACLTDDERRNLATRIRELLIPGWCAAPASQGVMPAQESRYGE